ncbi:uncharacterized protein [Euphorbia lathyris]|uniref:uncharacterized protein n=1 Tax=Euphorbia lathyris TaxID=212925 RepID=UPI003313993F
MKQIFQKPLVSRFEDDSNFLKHDKELTTREMATYGFYIAPILFVTQLRIEELTSTEENIEQIDEILGGSSSHGRIGLMKKTKGYRRVESLTTMSKNPMFEDAKKQFKMEIREEIRDEVKNEIREEVKNELSVHLEFFVQKLSLMNPSLNLNLDGVLSTVRSNKRDD